MVQHQMDPAVSWVADTLDYESVPVLQRSASAGGGPREEALRSRFWRARALLKLLTTVVAAVAIGATAAAMHATIDGVVGWRNAILRSFFRRGSLLQAYGAELAVSCGLALAAATAVQLWAPRAAGGGVTWVMAMLNGNNVQGLFTLRVFVLKFLGSAAALGASLCLGIEAPMVHLAACISAAASDADQWLWARLARQRWLHRALGNPAARLPQGLDDSGMAQLASGSRNSNVDRREMLSAGAAAGIAAAFGAPIGGVLFSLEEACSVWSRRIAWRCFLATAVAVIVNVALNPHLSGGLLAVGLRPLGPSEWLQQLPALVAVSAGGGLLGAAFNKLRLAVKPWRAHPKQHAARVREVVAVAALTVSCIAGLSAAVGRCLPVPPHWEAEGQEEVWLQHTCPAGHYNDLATAWLSPSVWSIRSFISLGTKREPLGEACSLASPCIYTPASLAAMCACYLPLMGLSATLAIPGGLFMPSMLLGGSFGALCGLVLRDAAPAGWTVEPGLYALCAATAVLGAVFRSSISTAVLMTEACGTLSPLLSIIVSVIASNACAVLLGTEGVYESELEAELHLNYLAQAPPPKLRPLVAEQLMSAPVEGLPRIVPAAVAESVLRHSQHNGFPVYDPLHSNPQMQTGTFRLDGFILRSQIDLLLQERVFCDRHGRYLHQHPAGDVTEFEDRLAAAMARRLQSHPSGAGPLAELAAGGADLAAAGSGVGRSSGPAVLQSHPSPFDNQAVEAHINLGPFMNSAPMAVRLDTTATRVYSMFTALSLRHIVVVDESNHAMGVITRRDLAHAAGSRLARSRSSAQAGPVDLDALLERPIDSL